MKKIKVNRSILTIILIIAALVLALVGLSQLESMDFSDSLAKYDQAAATEGSKIFLAVPDYETDIMTIPEYTEKNLYIRYTNGGETFTVLPEEYSSYGACMELFGAYFDALKAGDAETVNSFYSDEYFSEHAPFADITMQKIYDIHIEFISNEVEGSDVVYSFKVSYKIMRNDGTFRPDLQSDSAMYQLYSLAYDFDTVRITSVEKYSAY